MPGIDSTCGDLGIRFIALAVTGKPAAAQAKAGMVPHATILVAADATLDALGVTDVPTTFVFRDGRPVDRIDGEADPQDLAARIRKAESM